MTATRTWLESPLARLALQVLSAWFALSILARFSPLDAMVVAASGATAITIWLLEYEPSLTSRAMASSPGRTWFGLVARLSGQALPGAVHSTPQLVRLVSDQDFYRAARDIKDCVRGQDSTVDRTMEHIRRGIRIRQGTQPQARRAPLGIFVYAGHSGTGKRCLASAVGASLFGDSLVATLDAAQGAGCSQALLAAARNNPRMCLIVENPDRACAEFREDLRTIVSGEPLMDPATGRATSFDDWLIFLLVHKDARQLTAAGPAQGPGASGGTILAQRLYGDFGLDQALVWSAHEWFPFLMPDAAVQAEIVLLSMRQECERNGVTLTQVSPEVVVHEVGEIQKTGSFEQLPGRVSHRLRRPISVAAARADRRVVL